MMTESAAEVRTVTVQPGDSLSAISKRVYGSYNKWREIYQANSDKMSSENDLKVGMELVIP